MERTMKLFSTEYEDIDFATSRRATLWITALDMFQTHWLNGVGPRSYRYAYGEFARAGDFFVDRGGSGGSHPHWQLLEVSVETGVIGLSGYLCLFILLLLTSWRHGGEQSCGIWIVAAFAATLPLNTHLAFYGSYWATVIWLTIAMALAQTTERTVPDAMSKEDGVRRVRASVVSNRQ